MSYHDLSRHQHFLHTPALLCLRWNWWRGHVDGEDAYRLTFDGPFVHWGIIDGLFQCRQLWVHLISLFREELSSSPASSSASGQRLPFIFCSKMMLANIDWGEELILIQIFDFTVHEVSQHFQGKNPVVWWWLLWYGRSCMVSQV